MKTTIFSLTIGLALIFLFSCLKKQEPNENPNRVYFTIPAVDRKILVPVQFHDSITANLTFDTGGGGGIDRIDLDSTLIAQYPHILPEESHDTLQGGVAWTKLRYSNIRYNTPLTAKIGNTELKYSIVDVMNWKRYMGNNFSDGIFTIPQNDTTHVWELNFENNYLEIHSADKFNMPDEAFVLPVKGKDHQARFLVELPMKIQCADGDTLTLNRTFFIDTGMSWDVALMCKAEELELFNKKEAVWTSYLDSYFRHYEVKATLFDNFVIDSLRIYTFDKPNSVGINYLIGQHFLKHFNVFFDMKNQRLGLQPIKNFQRVVSPYRRFHLLFHVTSKGELIISKLADNKGNYYKTAGLQERDVIVSIDRMRIHAKDMEQWKGLSFSDWQQDFHERDTIVFGVMRKGKPMKIIVPIDKNEAQGD